MKKIFFPGSFNPFTKGHADIVERLLKLSKNVIIGIGANIEKPESKEVADRNAFRILDWIVDSGLSQRVQVIVYSGLTGETALKHGADCLARGVRNATDFDYEFSLAAINREAFGIETILIPADPAIGFVSSTAVRDLESHGREDIANKFKA